MKQFSKIVLTLYLIVLLWLILFKFSYDMSAVLLDHQSRSFSLIPFAEISRTNLREMLDNLIVFIPFGLLLGVNLKQTTFWNKLTLIFTVSLAAEALQYVFAIGTTDTTDVIMNTVGGLIGLTLYSILGKYIDNEKLDRFVVITGFILLVALLALRVFVFRVRY